MLLGDQIPYHYVLIVRPVQMILCIFRPFSDQADQLYAFAPAIYVYRSIIPCASSGSAPIVRSAYSPPNRPPLRFTSASTAIGRLAYAYAFIFLTCSSSSEMSCNPTRPAATAFIPHTVLTGRELRNPWGFASSCKLCTHHGFIRLITKEGKRLYQLGGSDQPHSDYAQANCFWVVWEFEQTALVFEISLAGTNLALWIFFLFSAKANLISKGIFSGNLFHGASCSARYSRLRLFLLCPSVLARGPLDVRIPNAAQVAPRCTRAVARNGICDCLGPHSPVIFFNLLYLVGGRLRWSATVPA